MQCDTADLLTLIWMFRMQSFMMAALIWGRRFQKYYICVYATK
jgi:hypothetical protein